MKNYLLLLLMLLAYSALSFILMLRDDWAIKTIGDLYPQLETTLQSARQYGLSHHLNTTPTLMYVLIIAFAFWFYFKVVNGKWIKSQSARRIVLWSLVLHSVVIISYPALSTDVFDYILQNRVKFVYQENLWVMPIISYPNDQMINLGSWQRVASVYGPTHHFFAAGAQIIGGSDLFGNILMFKEIAVIFSLITTMMLSHLIQEDKMRKLALFAMNPLLIIETAGNAHNDIIMVAFMIAALIAFKRKRFVIVGALLSLSTQVKLYGVVLTPFLLILLMRKKEYGHAALTLIGLLVTTMIGVAVMGPQAVANYQHLMKWVFTLKLNSLPNLLHVLPNWMFVFPFMIIAILGVRKIKSLSNVIQTYIGLTLLYLMFVIPLYWAWYVIWYLPFLSLIKKASLIKVGITLSLTSSLQYAILFLSHRFNYEHIIWTIIIYIFLVVPPIGVYAFTRHEK